MSQAGKGDAPRPLSIDHEKFRDNWDRIFSENNDEDVCAYSGLPAVHTYDEQDETLETCNKPSFIDK